ncbi:hypothetical protein [Lacinutrix jangbogonensis]|uniref:hypothetical protein n=1 Tax=Lacinutrix jangbogonensis TaxID=1469557 RepID=UPI00053DCEA0|nr:hypothetical protein [Lacinutrix jangbogonensis]
MKKYVLIVFLGFTLVLNANMASPMQSGTLGANPFLNNHVNVLHENILITIDEDFQYANFDIEYSIQSEKDGIEIPFLFYASEYYNDFKVTIDGKPVVLKKYNDFWDDFNMKNKRLTNFDYLYNLNREDISEINTVFKKGKSETINIDDFIYFETNIAKGQHSIKVSYKATKWQYKHSRINETSFRYA